ncbi:hypothetical protein MD484_g7639, partial [Candolleomyces efflorescens]
MEKHAELEDGQYGVVPELDNRGPMASTTFSVDEESTLKGKPGAFSRQLTSLDLDESPSLVSHQGQWKGIMADVIFLLIILFMLTWPWAVFSFFRSQGGIQMAPALAASIFNDTVFITFLGTFNRIIASYLFGRAIVRYGQERVGQKGRPLTVFGVSALLAFRHKSFMWSAGEWWTLFRQGRRLAVVASLALCLAAFAVIPTGTTALLAPVWFVKRSPLTGSEVDLTANSAECATWLEQNTPNHFYGCQGNQRDCLRDAVMTDALYAGRKSMVIANSDGSGLPQQLMADDSVRFLGPLQGILPIGPDGLRGFNTLHGWDRSSADSRSELDLSYSLTQQGLESNVRCFYDQESPIHYGVDFAGPFSSGSCDTTKGLREVLPFEAYPIQDPEVVWSLTSWVCAANQTSSTDSPDSDSETYNFYLRGTIGYANPFGNITCTLSNLRFRDYNVSYTKTGRYFTTTNSTTSPEPRRSPTESFIHELVALLGDLVWGTQTRSGHVIAESILDVGERLFNVSPDDTNDRHLKLVEGFTQGVLEFYAMHSRMLISSRPYGTIPASCNRTVEGSRTYEVFGWNPGPGAGQVLLLIPMTLMNLASLSIFVAAMIMGRFKYQHSEFQPMDTRALLTAKVAGEDTGSDQHAVRRGPKGDWEKRVDFLEVF